MSDLTDFLLARFAEDEADVKACQDWPECDNGYGCPAHPTMTRALREVEAKRRVVATAQTMDVIESEWGQSILRDLASGYSDHPDYREEWMG